MYIYSYNIRVRTHDIIVYNDSASGGSKGRSGHWVATSKYKGSNTCIHELLLLCSIQCASVYGRPLGAGFEMGVRSLGPPYGAASSTSDCGFKKRNAYFVFCWHTSFETAVQVFFQLHILPFWAL